jgi:hypothetical protein
LCPSGASMTCVDLQNSTQDCGSCGNICTGVHANCVMGSCR